MVMTTMHTQFFSPVSATWLAAGQPAGGGGSAIGRIALVAVAVLAVGTFAVLQIRARSDRRRPPSERRRRRRYDPSDWRTLPPPSWPAGRDDETPAGHQQAYRPDGRNGYPPGYDPYPAYEPARTTWAARDDLARGRRS